MRNRWRSLGPVLLAAVAVAGCGGGDDALIAAYFEASNAGDVRALEEIASVQFDQKVDAWTKIGTSAETSMPVTLPALAERYEELRAQLEAQREKSSRYTLDHLSEVNEVKTLLEEGKAIPAQLEEVAAAWKELSGKEEELKAAVAEAREAMLSEQRTCQASAGEASDLTTASGEILSKEVELSLTIGGEPRPYVMTLRRYMLEETDTPHEISRWIVHDLKPKS